MVDVVLPLRTFLKPLWHDSVYSSSFFDFEGDSEYLINEPSASRNIYTQKPILMSAIVTEASVNKLADVTNISTSFTILASPNAHLGSLK